MPSPTDDETPFPVLSLSALDRSHLSPHDAFTYPLRQTYDADGVADPLSHLRHLKDDRSRSRRRKRAWKKLMWVKQSCKFCLLFQRGNSEREGKAERDEMGREKITRHGKGKDMAS
jgi:hypothetical protein